MFEKPKNILDQASGLRKLREQELKDDEKVDKENRVVPTEQDKEKRPLDQAEKLRELAQTEKE